MSKAKVAVAGASGVLGSPVVKQLLAAGHPVVALTRKGSTSKLPSNPQITVAEVDYNSADSIAPHLEGCVAVVSAVGAAALKGQNPLIDAAVRAGVQRFFPSEFGSDTSNPQTKDFPVFGGKVATQNYLKEQAAAHPNFSYTFINNGPFFDYGLGGFIVNLKDHSARLYDGGDNKFSTTTLDGAGKAVVAVLANLDATKNRVVYVQETLTSQNELIDMAKKIDGKEWSISKVETDKLKEESYAELKKDKPNFGGDTMRNFLFAAIHAPGNGGNMEDKLDNELLGFKQMSREDVEALLKRTLEA